MTRGVFLSTLASAARGGSVPSLRTRQADIDYRVEVAGVSARREVFVWLPVPGNDDSQSIERLRFTAPPGYQVRRGVDGNRCFFVRVAADCTLGMSFRATRRETVKPLTPTTQPGEPPACCLDPDRLVPLDGQIRQWARQVVDAAGATSDLDKARAIYNHVVATVKYDKRGKGWGRGDLYYACDLRRGNCSDFHAIVIGFSRAVGLPARFAIGLPLPPERGRGEISGYHCWAEVYARGIGWIPIDASEAAKNPSRREYFFGAHDENRIELSRGRDLVLTPPQAGQPLNFFVFPYAESNGNPFPHLKTTITYADVA